MPPSMQKPDFGGEQPLSHCHRTQHAVGILSANGWFASKPLEWQRELCRAGRRVALAPGQWIYGQGDETNGLCAVLEGALRLEAPLACGHDALLAILSPPAIFGLTTNSGLTSRLATARAARQTTVLLFSNSALEQLAARFPQTTQALNDLQGQQLGMLVRLAAHLLVSPPLGRIAYRLDQVASNGVASVSQSDLAELCGLARKIVNAPLARLEADGVIQRGYREIRILRPRALEALICSADAMPQLSGRGGGGEMTATGA